MTVINKSVFCRNLDGARLLGHPVLDKLKPNSQPAGKLTEPMETNKQ